MHTGHWKATAQVEIFLRGRGGKYFLPFPSGIFGK
jgi:hypothetical protein